VAMCGSDSEILRNFKGAFIECENPNEMLYKFEGTLFANNIVIPINVDQILLRGSCLRNTEYIYGVVVFTGHETKIMKNSARSRAKFSKLERSTSKYILVIALMQVSISFLAALLNSIWEVAQYSNFPYIRKDDADKHGFFLNFIIKLGTWFLSLSNLVPISLMVTLECVKFIQAIFIYWDYSIYDEVKDMPTKVQSSNLNEELGTVHYVFSDKTGTLT
jgi:phospholipid-transporting ATPase